VATRIQLRRGTATQWTTADPVLEAGEIGWESNTNKFKIGDGINTWDDLTYFLDATDTGFNSADYILATARDSANGVAGVNADINVFTKTGVVFEGSSADDNETTLAVTNPTADRTITLPDATGTVVLDSATQTLTNKTLTTPVISSITNGAATLTLPTSTGTIALTSDIAAGIVTESGTQTLTNKTLTSPVITGAVFNDGSIVFEGATADAHETTFAITDPTADRTITFPDATGTVALTENVAALSGATFTGAISGTSLTLSGDLTINGTTTTINSTTLTIDDKNIVLADGNTSDASADGGGITLSGATNKTFNWVDATDAWTSSEHMNLLTGKSYKINGTSITAAIPAGLTWGEVKDGKSGLVIS
jgi:hypothetical protein